MTLYVKKKEKGIAKISEHTDFTITNLDDTKHKSHNQSFKKPT